MEDGGRAGYASAASIGQPLSHSPASYNGNHRPLNTHGGLEGDVDATMQAFAQWLSEMKSQSNNRLSQMLQEMGIIRDGITSNSTDLTEYKRHSISIQQQMQSQLTDLRERLTGAFGEITSLVKQKTATDQELMSEIKTLQQQLSMKTAELEALKRSYSTTHQQLQNNIIQIQGLLQASSGEIHAVKQQAEAVQDQASQKLGEVDATMQRLRGVLESTGRESQSHAMQIQEDIARLHEALTGLSADFFDHKRLTHQVQNKLGSQVTLLEENRKKAAEMQQSIAGAQERGPATRRAQQGTASHPQLLMQQPVQAAGMRRAQ